MPPRKAIPRKFACQHWRFDYKDRTLKPVIWPLYFFMQISSSGLDSARDACCVGTLALNDQDTNSRLFERSSAIACRDPKRLRDCAMRKTAAPTRCTDIRAPRSSRRIPPRSGGGRDPAVSLRWCRGQCMRQQSNFRRADRTNAGRGKLQLSDTAKRKSNNFYPTRTYHPTWKCPCLT